MSIGINQSFIKFIPKSRNLKLTKSRRPITLLNASYKIRVKALKLWLKYILSKIVYPKQTSFIRDCFILNNVIAKWEGMESTQSLGPDVLFIKIKFVIGYDLM